MFTAHRLAAACLILCGVLAAEEPAPTVPAKLQVPAGHAVLWRAEAQGAQIYKSVPTANGDFKWELEAPLANFYDRDGRQLGRHYEGPAWEALDGSKVKKVAEDDIIKDNAPNALTDIPWLLIHVISAGSEKNGAFSNVHYVQRIDTRGGLMPAKLPTKAGERVFVAYSAVYVFYN